jgi:membrane protease YdiL (CAAX protease family)
VAIGVVGAGGAMTLMHYFSTGESTMAKLVSTEEGLLAVSIIAPVAPLFEEMYYRGFIFPVLREKLGAAAAVTIVSLWFCFAHVFQLAGDWAGVPVILAMGVTWTVQRHRYDSLTPPIITHFTYNAGLIGSAWFL